MPERPCDHHRLPSASRRRVLGLRACCAAWPASPARQSCIQIATLGIASDASCATQLEGLHDQGECAPVCADEPGDAGTDAGGAVPPGPVDADCQSCGTSV